MRPPPACDTCSDQIQEAFVDGRTYTGRWASMCMDCYGEFGVGLGTGKGQRYEKQDNGSWRKVEG